MPDTIVCTILFPAEFQGGKNPTWTVRYKVEGSTDPEAVKAAPTRPFRARLDETRAARRPVLRWRPGAPQDAQQDAQQDD